MQRIASIDLGTNTCNLLIAERNGNTITHLHSERRVVKLMQNQSKDNIISKDAIKRCVDAFKDYKEIISQYNTNVIVAYATSGTRNAINKEEIVQIILSETGISLEIITGAKEAALVYSGVSKAINTMEGTLLLLDIGGGSNEFISYNKSGLLFANSFDFGIARLLSQNEFSDPLSTQNILLAEEIFDNHLEPLHKFAKDKTFGALIGSSGTFETLVSIYKHKGGNIFPNDSRFQIPMKSYKEIHNEIITSTFEERQQIPGMDIMRTEMIPLASVLVHYVLNRFNIDMIIYSRFSLKEGAIFDYIEKNKI